MPASYYDRGWLLQPVAWRDAPGRQLVLEPAAIMCAIAGGPVLDVGCGVGHLGELLDEMRIPYRLGLDTSPVAVSLAQHSVPAVVSHWAQTRRYLAHLHYRTVALLEVLEHVVDDLGLLAAIPAGRSVVASVPSIASLGHVRWFGAWAEVKARYGALVRIVEVTERKAGESRWWIWRGVRA